MPLDDTRTVAPSRPVRSEDGVGRFRWDVSTDEWWWSDGLFRLYGYEPQSVVPDMARFLAHKDPRDRALIDAIFARCVSEGGPFSCCHRIVDAGGRRRTVVVVGHGEQDAEGTRTVAVHGYMTDITSTVQRDATVALEAALKGRPGIEQVKGALMLVYGVGEEAAFATLRAYSQVYNTKLATIVANVLAAFAERTSTEAVSRAELDRLLWDAAHPTG